MANNDMPEWARKTLEEHDTKITRLEGMTDRLDALIRIAKEEGKKREEEHEKRMAELMAMMKEELELKQKVVMMVAALDKTAVCGRQYIPF